MPRVIAPTAARPLLDSLSALAVRCGCHRAAVWSRAAAPKTQRITGSLAVLIGLGFAAPTWADPVTWQFTVQVRGTDGDVPGQFGVTLPIGTTFSGSLTFEPQMRDTGTWQGEPFGIRANVGRGPTSTFLLGFVAPDPVAFYSFYGEDFWNGSFLRVFFDLTDRTGTASFEHGFPRHPPDLSLFTDRTFGFINGFGPEGPGDEPSSDYAAVSTQILSLEESNPAPVPEPATLTLMGFGLVGLAWKARARAGN
jgi:hypothetical protein